MKIEKMYHSLIGKTGGDACELFLPLWVHLSDTVGIMSRIIRKWLPDAVIRATGLSYDTFESVAVFLASVHDIGKATSLFQGVITKRNQDLTDSVLTSGLSVRFEQSMSQKTPHAYAGQWILTSSETGFGIPEGVASVVGAHHGKPFIAVGMSETDLIKVYPRNFFGKNEKMERDIWIRIWEIILKESLAASGLYQVEDLPELSLKAQTILSGLLVMADWIASNTSYFPLINYGNTFRETELEERLEEGWKRVCLPEIWESPFRHMNEELFLDCFGFLPNGIQKQFYQIVDNCSQPGLFILEAQMGIGKTEAALCGAQLLAARLGAGGIFFGLPTQATSNAMFPRLLSWASGISDDTVNAVRLAHNAAVFNETYRNLMPWGKTFVDEDEKEFGLEVHPWFEGNKKALLADFVIGTVDQFLMTALKRKFFMLRHLGVAGKVIIIDECHAYDVYMSNYLERALLWMGAYGVPVILLSATLPGQKRKELAANYMKGYRRHFLGLKRIDINKEADQWYENEGYPLITWTDGSYIHQKQVQYQERTRVINIEKCGSPDQMVSQLDELLSDGGCAVIILNTVRYAQEVYDFVRSTLTDAKITLCHSQFTMEDRLVWEKEIIADLGKEGTIRTRFRRIVIGTQVLEQSLDYDADILVTQLCPIDLLLQRMGRIHRHNRQRPKKLCNPKCLILEEKNEPWDTGTRLLYGDFLLMRTEKSLEKKICFPNDIAPLVQGVYNVNDDMGLNGEEYNQAKDSFFDEQKELTELARHYLLNEPGVKKMDRLLLNGMEGNDHMAEASVRRTEPSIEVLLMQRAEDEKIIFVSDNGQNDSLEAGIVPSENEAMRIVAQRLRLPLAFSKKWNLKLTINELEERNIGELSIWQQNPLLRGELVLLLDRDGTTTLSGYRICYIREKGLCYDREKV